MDRTEAIQAYQDRFLRLIEEMRKEVSPEVIAWVLGQLKGNLEMVAHCDAWLVQNGPHRG
jgi:hypothetical protein